jgi:CrcB protein
VPADARRHPQREWDVLGAIASGGAFGGLARWGIENVFGARPDAFPWATFVVNVSGAFVLSALLVLFVEVFPPSRYARPFIGVGFLGAYTTFSTWMIEAARLVSHGSARLGLGYLLASMFAGLAAVWLGLIVGKAIVLGYSAQAAEED